ncbi:hypothetical protein [Candidatus Pantoea floridensis]|uniref:Uncharacterized protein n=1 Tax=Candidatus Pantoea floridensis TaxID=1938870 RepID=A0A286BXC6_9GAMM|nr:hypothetical protein [Pantoea floridensis]PIF21287.1 hypothetical protein BX596_0679 [Enterobacteriaceae bacterium JKS000233]SOD38799.1 hypothetical protein SAMN06273570_3232 [Pantoea floridensis]
MPSDHELVNFSQDYELNYVLNKVGKRQTETNRAALRKLGAELKNQLGRATLTHSQLYQHVKNRLALLE